MTLHGDRPSLSLLVIADRTIRVAHADIDRSEIIPLEIGGHGYPGRRYGTAGRDMLADAAHGQGGNGGHRGTSGGNDAHFRGVLKVIQLGASLGANNADPMTE